MGVPDGCPEKGVAKHQNDSFDDLGGVRKRSLFPRIKPIGFLVVFSISLGDQGSGKRVEK